ncbi:cation diffusion facilitator family transporter [Evansella vedderi]|uniref:Cation diffusion facilitator family transporter n=1 Tax=Evansella vedderi TaxID=38282 RepID=A0ABU0A3K4_9BACI|nr:cation diffusion facilitator family transporter [Evansella vedderi]MDQ0257825.1 cation diffusion facilitator family transporter [Evansella vedderi]
MFKSLASESKLLKISVLVALFFAILGVVWGKLVSSQLILFDGLYSLVSVMLSLLSLLVAQYIKKNDTKRFPYGKEMLEPVVIIIKYAVILILCIVTVITAIESLLSGGRETSVGQALIFAVVNTIGCVGVYFLLNKNKDRSGFIQAEANQWKMDTLISGAVLLGFFTAVIISFTSYQFLIPYVDPLMVLIVAGYFIKVPIVEITRAFREVLEMSPDQVIETNFKKVVNSIETRYQINESILRIAKVGNKLFIEIDFILNPQSKIVTIADQDKVREEIIQQTKGLVYKKWLTVSFTNDKRWAQKDLA